MSEYQYIAGILKEMVWDGYSTRILRHLAKLAGFEKWVKGVNDADLVTYAEGWKYIWECWEDDRLPDPELFEGQAEAPITLENTILSAIELRKATVERVIPTLKGYPKALMMSYLKQLNNKALIQQLISDLKPR